MTVQQKPVERQVIVITGASSGIGLAAAHMAAERGARLVLVARNAEALTDIARECGRRGGSAVPVAADVSRREDVERVAQVALETYGGFDTWVNDASVSVYGNLLDVPVEDQRHLFEVNYWGMVYGSFAAARHLRTRGGTIINIGSVLSDRTVPYQTQYCASKHAIKSFTDGLRMELEAEGAPISVTLIKPASIDTPFPEHARNYLGENPTVPPPAYDPHVVGKAILFAAENPKRTLTVGFGGAVIGLMGSLFPRPTDFVMEKAGLASQTTEQSHRPGYEDNLYEAREDGDTHSSETRVTRQSSLYLEAQMRPLTTFALLAGVGVGAALLLGLGSKRRSRSNGGHAAEDHEEFREEDYGFRHEDAFRDPRPMGTRTVYESREADRGRVPLASDDAFGTPRAAPAPAPATAGDPRLTRPDAPEEAFRDPLAGGQTGGGSGAGSVAGNPGRMPS